MFGWGLQAWHGSRVLTEKGRRGCKKARLRARRRGTAPAAYATRTALAMPRGMDSSCQEVTCLLWQEERMADGRKYVLVVAYGYDEGCRAVQVTGRPRFRLHEPGRTDGLLRMRSRELSRLAGGANRHLRGMRLWRSATARGFSPRKVDGAAQKAGIQLAGVALRRRRMPRGPLLRCHAEPLRDATARGF